MKAELEQILSENEDIEKIIKHLHMHLDSSDVCCTTDPTSIFYEPNDYATKNDFSDLIDAELELRNLGSDINLIQPLNVRRAILREHLITENKYEYLKQHSNISYDDAMILIKEAIPCVLHLRNRTGEKIFKEVVKDAISNVSSSTSAIKQIEDLKKKLIWF